MAPPLGSLVLEYCPSINISCLVINNLFIPKISLKNTVRGVYYWPAMFGYWERA